MGFATGDERAALLAAARGERPCDLVLRNARLVNVASGEVLDAEVAVFGGRVAGIGEGLRGGEEVDLAGRFVCPGLIDAHVHIESAMVPPAEFARAVLPRGVTAVVTDPHEIANVLGLEGVRFMLQDARRSPLAVFVNAPSCVPATPLSTGGAALAASDLAPLLAEPEVLGLAEMMNFPGAVAGDPAVLAKLDAFAGRVLDGHAPGLTGCALGAYAAAGIRSDHESTTVAEAREKLRLGMTVFLRDATNARNLKDLLPLVTPANERRLCLCTDDRQVPDLLQEGSVDHMVRACIAAGVDPVAAIRMATLNTAAHFRLFDRGMVAPGCVADLVVFEDLQAPLAVRVYAAGRLVAEGGAMTQPRAPGPPRCTGTVKVDWTRTDLALPAAGTRVRVIGVVPDQLVTRHETAEARVEGGRAVADPGRDLLKMAVIERHRATGRAGLGFVRGLGLRRGALASTVAHDHHNLVVVGADDRSKHAPARALEKTGGGLAAAEGDRVLAVLPLPIAGLMSDGPLDAVGRGLGEVLAAARALGSPLHDPFMAMSFLALEVIPALKLTDQGLVDVEKMELVPLFVP